MLDSLGGIEEFRHASDLPVLHVVETPLNNLVDEVEDVGQILMSKSCSLLLKGERLVKLDRDLTILAIITSSKDCLFTIINEP